jgi:hypothetical protein
VTAWVRRLLHYKQKTATSTLTPLTPEELTQAQLALIKYIQLKEFGTEVQFLQQQKPLSQKSKLLTLKPFLDADGILRIGGRLRHSDLPDEQKHPILLPRHSRLTDLIIRNLHHQNYHAGPTLLLSLLQRQFWVVRGREAVRFLTKKCTTCRRHAANTLQQIMGDLPRSPVTPGPAFNKCGVDFAGPFSLRPDLPRIKVALKAYFCIFICYATRTIHLELVSSLSTEGFLAALRRFVSRRNRPSEIFSDCGTNFVGAAR